MKYGSVCSGIEAASVAWHNLGWEPQWFSEIEQFPSEVLKHRFPDVPNLGDMTQLTQNPTFNERPIDLLVGGTPCQSFSVAGLRKGLADPRGNLMLTFLSIADKFRPKWVVWENVPGVLSSNGGKDFGTFLGALGELGYGFAYRVLDAQHFGVAQRRRRVFVVGYLGDWRVAAAVLFERESLQGNIKPSRKKREEVTANAQGSVGDAGQVVIDRAAFNQGENARFEPRIEIEETMSALVARGPHAVAQPIPIHDQATRFNGKRGNKQDGKGNGLGIGQEYDPSPTLTKGDRHAVAQPLYYESHPQDSRVNGPKDVADTVSANYGMGGGNTPLVQQPIAVDWRTAQVDQGITQTLKTDLAKMSGPCIAVDTYNYTTNDHTTQTIRSQSDTEHIGAVLHSIDFRKSFYEIKKDVLVRKYPVDTDSLKRCLKKHKKISNNKISELLNLPKTKIEHWFRQDDSFAIPSAEHWFQLKEILHIETNIFDQSITEFIIEENKYDSTNRIYDSTFPSPTLTASNSGSDNYITPMAIRRLTPKECERLQGFPDDWTKIPYRNKPADQCPDGPRYKACGNSMAVPVMRWIGERINLIESML